jgi:4-alpha-glucanotransferase
MDSPLLRSPSSPGYKEALSRAAELWGIEQSYWDIFGTHHFASEEVIRAILRSLGVDATSTETIEAAIRARQQQQSRRPLPPTVVITVGADLPVSMPPGTAEATADVRIQLEDGTERTFQTRLAGACIPLPRDLPLGYHQITVAIAAHDLRCASRLIVCPEKAYAPPDGPAFRAAGIGVSLYGLRSAGNWGCGDFSDLMRFTAWAVDALGASFIALNPLHAISNRAPYNTSPYLPNCSYYRNFIYIDVEAVPEFTHSCWARHLLASKTVQRELASLREAGEVQYERVSSIKLRFLKLAFREFLKERRAGSERARDFQAWADREGELLHRFAVHSALDEAIHRRRPDVWNWPAWPEPLRSPGSPETRAFARKHWRSVLFYQYVQWIADAQLARAQEHARSLGMRIGLYHDVALATDRFGADLWMLPEYYVAGCRVGAPPDDFSPKGQDWGFPPPNSDAYYRDGYRLFTESIRKACQHGGALRIDHVMRFFHLFWIPDGMEANAGTYVRDRHEDLIRILALESVRNGVIIVGEDLGTVPDQVRETLARFGVLSYRLFYF